MTTISADEMDEARWALDYVRRLSEGAPDTPSFEQNDVLDTIEQVEALPVASIVVSLTRGFAMQVVARSMFEVLGGRDRARPMSDWFLPVRVLQVGDARTGHAE